MIAMIFAAGLGSRLRPLTNDRPKALVEVAGKPLLQHCIENLKDVGVTKVVINIHHFGQKIIDFLEEHNNFDIDIRISDERDELLDTGGGLKKASSILLSMLTEENEPILIINVDIISSVSLKNVIAQHQEHENMATLVVRDRSTSRYLLFNDEQQLVGWTNISTKEVKESRPLKGDENRLAFSGIHVISPNIFQLITEEGKFSIIHTYLHLAKTQKIQAYHDKSKLWFDLGKFEQLKQAEEILLNSRN
ncbi:nucleotidyltransferase family protein [Puteibacter caeruleilacunae]|nr:nucleotidyltransferase family protein [Puteibacter caeruleilacunae]